MHRSLVSVFPLAVSLFTVAGCDAPAAVEEGPAPGYREAWHAADDPSLLDAHLEYRLARLPTEGEAERTPWAGSYWPAHRDSINDRWAGPGTLSPARKYELAFGKHGIEDAVSAYAGVDSVVGSRCSTDAQCAADRGSVCARRAGEHEGVCTETWVGICHAWAPAAILEDEPRRAVQHGGVEFRVNDLKALVSLSYTAGLEVRFLSLRCEGTGAEDDLWGEIACRDTNPGSFHVVVANLLGLEGRSLIEDRVYDREVWNQPLRGFRVTRSEAVTGRQANQLLGVGEVLTSVRREGTLAPGAWRSVAAPAVAPGQTLRARMTGTGDVDLHVRWDREPTASAFDCRPYAEGSDELCELVAPPGATSGHVAVRGYAPGSTYEVEVEVVDFAPPTYAFNPEAAALRRVQTELRWIAESDQDVDGSLAGEVDAYTQTDVVDYVLELDEGGRIVGGEWLGSSKVAHPDFLWLPIAKRRATVAGIVWDDVKTLLAKAR